jgi:hypothetical protein
MKNVNKRRKSQKKMKKHTKIAITNNEKCEKREENCKRKQKQITIVTFLQKQ